MWEGVLTLSARGTYLRAVSTCTKRAVRAVRQVTCPVSQATGFLYDVSRRQNKTSTINTTCAKRFRHALAGQGETTPTIPTIGCLTSLGSPRAAVEDGTP